VPFSVGVWHAVGCGVRLSATPTPAPLTRASSSRAHTGIADIVLCPMATLGRSDKVALEEVDG
jgi:hypothetical protein